MAVSIIDDGVAIVMYEIFTSFVINPPSDSSIIIQSFFYFCGIIFGSMVLGYIIGAAFVYFLIRTKHITENKITLCSLLFCVVYVSNSCAFMIQFSGIISTLFTAIAFKRYFERTIGNVKDYGTNDLFLFLSQFFENVVFLHIGFTMYSDIAPDHPNDNSNIWTFVGWSLLLSVVSRAVQVYPLTLLVNWSGKLCSRREHTSSLKINETDEDQEGGDKTPHPATNTAISNDSTYITMNYQHMMFMSGVRGPIAYATSQAYSFQNSAYIQAATDFIILVTVVLFGFVTYPMLYSLGIEMNCDEIDYSQSRASGNHIGSSSSYCHYLEDQMLKIDNIISRNLFAIPVEEGEELNALSVESEQVDNNVTEVDHTL